MAKLACHAIPYHGLSVNEIKSYGADMALILDPDPRFAATVKQDCNVKVVGRSYTIPKYSQFSKAKDAAAAIENHVRSLPAFGIVDIWIDNNEPVVNPGSDAEKRYIEAVAILLEHGTKTGITWCWGNFSAGRPPSPTGEGVPDWSPYAILFDIAAAKHYLGLHEYWPKAGPYDGYMWYAGRYQHIPYNASILITECGMNQAIVEPKLGESGWRKNVSQSDYLMQLTEYLKMINKDNRIKQAFIYCCDYSNPLWEQFDINGLGGLIGYINKQAGMPITQPPLPIPPVSDTKARLAAIIARLGSVEDAVYNAANDLEIVLREM